MYISGFYNKTIIIIVNHIECNISASKEPTTARMTFILPSGHN